jgi:hypothetical protein
MPEHRIPYFPLFFGEAHTFIKRHIKVSGEDCFRLGPKERNDYYLKSFNHYWKTEKLKKEYVLLVMCYILASHLQPNSVLASRENSMAYPDSCLHFAIHG